MDFVLVEVDVDFVLVEVDVDDVDVDVDFVLVEVVVDDVDVDAVDVDDISKTVLHVLAVGTKSDPVQLIKIVVYTGQSSQGVQTQSV